MKESTEGEAVIVGSSAKLPLAVSSSASVVRPNLAANPDYGIERPET